MQNGELAGVAIGATVLLNVMFAWYDQNVAYSIIRLEVIINYLIWDHMFYKCTFVFSDRAISGGIMNPAGPLGLAIVSSNYKGVWIYIVGPTAGGVAGSWAYNLIRSTDKQVTEITRNGLPKLFSSK